MRPRRLSKRCYFLLLHFLIISLAYPSSAEVSEAAEAEKTLHDVTVSQDQQRSIPEATTASVSQHAVDVADADRRSMLSTVVETVLDYPRNKSDIFRPSVHLGAIEEPLARASDPLNNMQHMRFEDSTQSFTPMQQERSQSELSVLQDVHRDMPALLDEATRSSRIRFQDEVAMPTPNHPFDRQTVMTESALKMPLDKFTAVGHVYVDQSFFQDDERPAEVHGAIPEKTMGDHRLNDAYLESVENPYVINYYTAQNQHQDQPRPASHGILLEMPIRKPESNGVLLLHESTYTRKRKFPYQFYQPSSDEHHETHFTEEQRHPTTVYSRMRKISPWKKIARLIGTFLPLGLLLATLTPNVVRINNTTTQPSILLSKLRVVDLPLEHKRARTLDHSEACEDRSICELILAGSEPQSDILQNILWNVVTRIPDDVAKRNGLREVFSAVKKKDCTMISC